MDVLKKIRGATLIETLTASVLIVLVFMMASLTLNTIFTGTIKRDTSGIQARIQELYYLELHDKITLPYQEDYKNWEISIAEHENRITIAYRKEGKEQQLRYTAKIVTP